MDTISKIMIKIKIKIKNWIIRETLYQLLIKKMLQSVKTNKIQKIAAERK